MPARGQALPASVTAPAALARKSNRKVGASPKTSRQTTDAIRPNEDQETITGAISERTDYKSEHHAEPQHDRHELSEQRHTHVQIGRHLGKENRRHHKDQRRDKGAAAQRHERPPIGGVIAHL